MATEGGRANHNGKEGCLRKNGRTERVVGAQVTYAAGVMTGAGTARVQRKTAISLHSRGNGEAEGVRLLPHLHATGKRRGQPPQRVNSSSNGLQAMVGIDGHMSTKGARAEPKRVWAVPPRSTAAHTADKPGFCPPLGTPHTQRYGMAI